MAKLPNEVSVRVKPDIDLTKFQETAAELKDASRAAHEVLKDLRMAQREVRNDVAYAQGLVPLIVDERLEEQLGIAVQARMIVLGDKMDEAIKEAEAAIFKRFDTLFAELLGYIDDIEGKRQTPLPELVKKRIAHSAIVEMATKAGLDFSYAETEDGRRVWALDLGTAKSSSPE